MTNLRGINQIRVLFLTRYDEQGPSSRVRAFQFFPDLQAAGIRVDSHALLKNDYVKNLYRGKKSIALLFKEAVERAFTMLKISRRSFDLLWIEKELLPFAPALLEHLLIAKIPYVLDLDDAIFHNYDLSGSSVVRSVLGKKIDSLMSSATVVTCGNSYLADRARQAGAKKVEILPSVVDMQRYSLNKSIASAVTERDSPTELVWIGSPMTAKCLDPILDTLEKVGGSIPLALKVIGAQLAPMSNLKIRCVPWSAETEVSEIYSADIGVMPLSDEPWERGKCGFKLIQYMACGLPVIASPVGVNKDIVRNGLNGFLATDEDSWANAILTLSKSAQLRTQFGAEGKKAARDVYSIQATAPILAKILRNAVHP